MTRITDKIKEIDTFLHELNQIVPSTLEDYRSNIEKKAACERYVEKIMEAVTDLAFVVIKMKKLKIPEDDNNAFNILLENKIIDNALAVKLKSAKGMKNIISHQYGKVDDGIVFEVITEELDGDVRDFMEKIKLLKQLTK